jgi:hypothetical protein
VPHSFRIRCGKGGLILIFKEYLASAALPRFSHSKVTLPRK